MPDFHQDPILNSPYACPDRHWELEDGSPTGRVIDSRRACSYLTPIPRSKHRRKDTAQGDLFTDQPKVAVDGVEYDPTSIVNQVRSQVDSWRRLPESQWGVTPSTGRLLRHWRSHEFSGIRPFFCQIEAVETAIWLAEVAPRMKGRFDYNRYLQSVNAEANPDLFRIALKLATGAGKTMVMAMLIAWQTANAVRHPGSRNYSRSFLIVTPGITIRDRLARTVQSGNSEEIQYYHKNYLDHVYAITDEDGKALEYIRYTAFGLPTYYNQNGIKVATSPTGNQFTWNGKRLDPHIGWYVYHYRHYSPEMGRWTSRDPIGEDGGVNLYGFVENGPLYAWDYLGNQEGDDSYRPPIVDLRMSPRGSQYRDGSSNALTSRPEYHNNPNTQVPKLPPTERPIGTPRTTYGGVAGLAGLAADSMSKGLPGFLRANGWRMCHDQVAYSLEGVMKRCCCCIITIQMLIQPGTTRNMLIPGMLGHGVVVKGSCRDAMKLDIEQGTLGQRYNPISPFRYWLHDKVNLPLPKPPPQTTEVFYEDWGCAE